MFQPELGVVAAAGGAMAVAAGMAGGMRFATLWAIPKLTAGFRRTAARQITQNPPVRRGHAFSKLLHVRRAVAADDVRQCTHYRFAIIRPTCWAAVLLACSVIWV